MNSRDLSEIIPNGFKPTGIDVPAKRSDIIGDRRNPAAHYIYKIEAVALPLATLFRPAALEYRLRQESIRNRETTVELMRSGTPAAAERFRRTHLEHMRDLVLAACKAPMTIDVLTDPIGRLRPYSSSSIPLQTGARNRSVCAR